MMAPVVIAMMLKTIPVKPIGVSCIYGPWRVLAKIVHYPSRLESGRENRVFSPKHRATAVDGGH